MSIESGNSWSAAQDVAFPAALVASLDADRDLDDAYELQASCFVTKPADLDEFLAAVRGIKHFSMQVVKLPPHREPRFVA
jgi:DNA-binding NarL/FixJ family response regulator